VTRYNQKTYKVTRVEFTMSPETTFDKDGIELSYKEYYKSKYNENVADAN